jgi:hypothetical protein
VSHGCVNPSPENARTYYKLAVLGDPVTITGSRRAGTWGDGWTVWFLSWSELLEESALHEAVRAGPKGSSFVERAALRPPHGRAPLGTSRPGNADATPVDAHRGRRTSRPSAASDRSSLSSRLTPCFDQ